MYAKFGTMENSLKIFEELNYREIISWNALISGYTQNGQCQEAVETFFSATKELQPNAYTFGSVLSAIGAAEAISLRHGQRCHSHLARNKDKGTDPVGVEVVGFGDDALLQGSESDVGIVEAGVLEADGWVDGNALAAVAKLVEVAEEVAMLGVVASGSMGGGGEDGEGGEVGKEDEK
ncbi:hypothetical protein NL676_035570 [Syzygium grande]|nr:hypothetical protein NL676_035570 [Syzygium grande]